MTLVKEAYNQIATYWEYQGQDAYGSVVYSSPRTVLVRWEESTEQFMDQSGEDRVSNAVVWMLEKPAYNSYLAYGDLTAHSQPQNASGAYEIKRIDRVPDIRGLEEELVVYL